MPSGCTMSELTGTIFETKRFAVHDGRGLRTTLFLKGCPLRCPWCQNPEGLEMAPVLWYVPNECLRCGTCAAACPEKALRVDERVHMNRQACTMCGACEAACPAGALQQKGRRVSARQAAQELLRDRVFFGEDGGVTLSGGEVLLQWRFAAQVLQLCKEEGASTAIESCLHGPREAVDAMLAVTDHFMVDVKILDEAVHKQVMGVSNRLILDNLAYLISRGADVLVRTPLIPGYTATQENIREIARYLKNLDPQIRYELLNFNPLCRSKYEALEWTYPVTQTKALTAGEMEGFYKILEEEGILHIVRE